MPTLIRNWWWEALCVLVYAALAGSQLFMKPITGLADNGDFAKVLGKADTCSPPDQLPFQYVYAAFRISPECQWDGRVTSSELLFTRLIKAIATWSGRDRFSIQSAGKVHLCVMLFGLAVLLWSLRESRPLLRYGLPPLAILIFSDVAYVAYLNSFYTDAAALGFLMLSVSLSVAAVLRPRVWIAVAFGVAAVLFITSKAQHAVLGPLVAMLAVWLALRTGKPASALWITSAAGILAATLIMVNAPGVDYKSQALYNMIFFRLTTQSPSPVQTLRELGLPASDEALIGTHAFLPTSPTADENWERNFLTETSFAKLVLFYLRHPDTALDLIWETLRGDAPGIRPANLANYRREDGFPPGALARRFDAWSRFRSWLLRVSPLHVVILYALTLGGSMACMLRSGVAKRWPLYPIPLALSVGGAMEFTCAACLDCIENARHLFLFHVITEILILFAFAAFLQSLSPARTRGTAV